jgi:2-polyprenyl-6-methoxyphenol hydroxylase-like FAD-dependent oxidoreductase
MQRDSQIDEFDVIIVGYGPVGRLLALKLGKRGHRVLVLERQKATYFLPRAVHVDDEACRILQSVGASPDRMPAAIGAYDDFYEWRNEGRETLLRLDWRGRGPSGWNVSNFFNQPLLEKYLHGLVGNEPTVTVRYDTSVTTLSDHGDHVDVQTRDSYGLEHSYSGSYVVGADGARSMVRDWIGGETTDLGYFHDWLVVDLVMNNDAVTFDPPAWQLCDPRRPTTLVPGGPGRRRFEFMRLPSETAEELNAEPTAWKLLAPWGIGPEDADLERHTIYTFQAKWADEWRRGRVLIAGDAAHLMPPFAGQGMCSGLRDAVNVEWKLHHVLTGLADESLLDTYGSERKEHVRHFIAASMSLGEVICITDPEEAEDRDLAMRADFLAGVEQPPRPLPRLGDGFFDPTPAGGLLSVQAIVESEKGTGLFDDVIEHDGYLVVSDAVQLERLSLEQREALRERGVICVAIGDSPDGNTVVDVDGTLTAWLQEFGATGVLVRPDFYVFGAANDQDGPSQLVDRYLAGCNAQAIARVS